MRKVFVSYNHEDSAVAARITSSLRKSGIDVIIDCESMPSGDGIQHFIEDSIRKADVTLSIVSNRSLESAWVALESMTAYWFDKLDPGSRRFIPCYLDADLFDPEYSLKLKAKIDQEQRRIRELIKVNYDQEIDPLHLVSRHTRLKDLSDNLGRILARLNDSLTMDIREDAFERSMARIIETILLSPTAPECRFEEVFNREIANTSSQIDRRFVRMTMLIDKGEKADFRWEQKMKGNEREAYDDLQALLTRNPNEKVFALLGAPGSGKTTLLKRLEIDHYREGGRSGNLVFPFFAPLGDYEPEKYSPEEWLISRWSRKYGQTGLDLTTLLNDGRVLLLLDALNEMPHQNPNQYQMLIDRWHSFINELKTGNRVVVSCRSLDYSQPLSRQDMRVPNIEIQPLSPDKVQEFLRVNLPVNHESVWNEIVRNGTDKFYVTPYFLSLLCQQVEANGEIPGGRASLFTAYVREAMKRELKNQSLTRNNLLDENDRLKFGQNLWDSPFQLPAGGGLAASLSRLAHGMQSTGGIGGVNKQVTVDQPTAERLIGPDRADEMLKAGVDLNLLLKDIVGDTPTYRYQHQLLQEYFAARLLALNPDPALVRVAWRATEVRPSLAETLAKIAKSEPLPELGQTGWEETALTAAAIAKSPESFIRDLMDQNLPLAARCATSPEVRVSAELKNRIRERLVDRTQDMTADLRARIAAGKALGLIGDPRFTTGKSEVGDYLLPPTVEIAGGRYPIGAYLVNNIDQFPRHKVAIDPFRIGIFPVTNAEYARFMAADGYDDERWWDTPEALDWLREGGAEGQRKAMQENRYVLQSNSEEAIRASLGRASDEQIYAALYIRNLSDEEFEQVLNEYAPAGVRYRKPGFWEDDRFNNPQQPVVGISWFEARAYCNWLSAATGEDCRLPTEVEYEAAARGRQGRKYSYGRRFNSSKCNTFESHIRGTTPVGIFDNRTPEGAYDLTGNVWCWTSTIYDQQRYAYPYRPDDGREDPVATGVRRLVRGGSWYDNQGYARAAYRSNSLPASRDNYGGVRVVFGLRPPSLKH